MPCRRRSPRSGVPTPWNVLPSAVTAPRAQGNSTPKRFRSLSRSPGFFGRGAGGGPPNAGGSRGLHGLVLFRRDLDMERHDLGQTEEARAGGLPLGVAVIRGSRQRQHRASEEDRGADQGRGCGEGSSTHCVTSRGDDRRADEGPSSLVHRSHPAAEDAPISKRCDPRMRVARQSCGFFVTVPQHFAQLIVRSRGQRGARLGSRCGRNGMGKALSGPRIGSPASSFQRRTCSAVRTARMRSIAGLPASSRGFPDCISRI